MIIALMVGWFVAGLLLAVFVAGAVRVAEARGGWELPTGTTPPPVTRAEDFAQA